MRPRDWFEIRPFVPLDRRNERQTRVHAKAFGTTLTACGLSASNMHKDWNVAFRAGAPGTCQVCARAIATSGTP
jgi:hypothetical protein